MNIYDWKDTVLDPQKATEIVNYEFIQGDFNKHTLVAAKLTSLKEDYPNGKYLKSYDLAPTKILSAVEHIQKALELLILNSNTDNETRIIKMIATQYITIVNHATIFSN